MKSAPYIFLGLVISGFLSACSGEKKVPDGQEEFTLTAPDSQSRAFVWIPELGGLGATVSNRYQVWLQNLGADSRVALVFEADKTSGIRIGWRDKRVLVICYVQAQIVHFHNFFVVAERAKDDIYRVEVILKKVSNLDACSGSEQ